MTTRPATIDNDKAGHLSKFNAVDEGATYGPATLQATIRDDLLHEDEFTPEYRAWLEAHR